MSLTNSLLTREYLQRNTHFAVIDLISFTVSTFCLPWCLSSCWLTEAWWITGDLGPQRDILASKDPVWSGISD